MSDVDRKNAGEFARLAQEFRTAGALGSEDQGSISQFSIPLVM